MLSSITRFFLSLVLLFSISLAAAPPPAYAQAGTATAAAVDYSAQLKAIEDKIEARRKELGIPGVSLVIVKDDKVIYMKGLGYKDFEKKVPVTEDTQFAIGSATKAFTALSVLMSQDEGKLSIDDPPKKVLPYFKMYDPETDKNILIRDLLCHSSGLNRTDLAMITGKLNRAELIQVAAQAKPTAKLREKFQYQNIMFAAAGEIVAKVQKQPWEKFVPEHIFKPLGMTNSTMSIKEMQKAKDFSFGYNYNFDTKETKRLPFREIGEVAPAGSINSSARDMSQWLRFVLNGGTAGGKRLVSEAGYNEWLKPQMKIAGSSSYGFGWFLQDWKGLKVVQHGGNIDGFNSMVAMIPEKKIGFVLLTNVSGSPLGNDAMSAVWENLITMPKPVEGAKLPVKTMQFMVGKYRLEVANLDFEVKIVGEDLVLVVPGQPEYKLERTAPRDFKMAGAPDGFSVKFSPEQGDATELYLRQPQGNYTLPRVNADGTLAKAAPPPAAAGASGAKELVGRYAMPGGNGSIDITESGGNVTFNISGQQPYTLVEKEKDTYSMSPLPDSYSLRAKRDAAGKVISVVTSQPEGQAEFKRLDTQAEAAPTIGVDELMQKVIDAAGGEANWRKLTSRVAEYDTDFESQGVKATGTNWAKAPNLSAASTEFIALGKNIGSEYAYFDGTTGADNVSFAPAEMMSGKQLEDARVSADFYGILNWKANYKKVEVSGMQKVGGEDCWVVKYTSEKGTNATEFISAKTFLVLRRDGFVASSTSSQTLPYTVKFEDYREVDGVKLPFKVTTDSVSNGTIVTTYRSIRHNVPVDDKVFAPRKFN